MFGASRHEACETPPCSHAGRGADARGSPPHGPTCPHQCRPPARKGEQPSRGHAIDRVPAAAASAEKAPGAIIALRCQIVSATGTTLPVPMPVASGSTAAMRLIIKVVLLFGK